MSTEKKLEIAGNEQVFKIKGEVVKVGKLSVTGERMQGEWDFVVNDKVSVKCQKSADTNKVSCSVLIGGVVKFQNLSAQGMFTVVNKLTDIPTKTIDTKYYQKSSPYRKGGAGKVSQVVDTSKLEDVTI